MILLQIPGGGFLVCHLIHTANDTQPLPFVVLCPGMKGRFCVVNMYELGTCIFDTFAMLQSSFKVTRRAHVQSCFIGVLFNIAHGHRKMRVDEVLQPLRFRAYNFLQIHLMCLGYEGSYDLDDGTLIARCVIG